MSNFNQSIQALIITGKTFYITASILCLFILLVTLYITIYLKPKTNTSGRLKGLALTALWACVSILILILLSSWQGLPLFGNPKIFWLVLGILIVWLNGIWLYRLIAMPKKYIQEQQFSLYTSYLPNHRKNRS